MKKTLCMSLTVVLTVACAQGMDPQARLSQLVDIFHDTQAFMGTVIITQKGKITFEKSVGLADVNRSLPNTSDTVYRVASITKSFTAVAVLKLQEEGKLKVTDPLSTYLPDYPNGQNITLHHLLTHTSGVFNFTERANLLSFSGTRPSLAELTRTFDQEPVYFKPGEGFHYSNSGYILLGRVIEVASGMPYETYLQQKVLSPLGWKASGFHRDDVVVPARAEGHQPSGEGFEKANLFTYEVTHAAGGLSATPRELAQWLPGILSGKLLAPESVQRFTSPVFTDPRGNPYAYGVTVGKLLGKTYVGHGGALPGYTSFMAYFPDEQLGVVLLSNVTGRNVEGMLSRLYLAYHQQH
ncbi:serine hydrolase domain-containing protein [Deinococcus cellulosilyticus]|uniref:Serine hydrolase n=1 Tax=Deinococcus cellulosilyticus (strain DSM 18568 / NBRC 106333 / KACC 11606 / 5516J-15) TaxID=1223518 RepID=A0A511MYE7_DEIC1|nr:serine hydrolase domain-containing protein [Deinococcus cellulosilyticus]GEM45593.1 serine hydrolase [Deinococcus cellulosilyticus NBRC 106333 = KACC 11606]